MRRLLRNPVFVAAVAAYTLHVLIPHRAEVLNRIVSREDGWNATQSAPPQARKDLSKDGFSTSLSTVSPPAADPRHVALLSEPIVILRGNEYSGVQLPKGTPVTLLDREGEFCRIRHGNSVVTVPRKALIAGAYATRQVLH